MNNPNQNPRGLLCIWTGVDPAHELDFNRWYDREHMQERVAIPGFQSARRFAAVGPSERPYLALYYTDDLEVFTSQPYRQAFANQTAWSRETFTRMRGTQRRVGRLTVEAGDGEGGALALFVLPPQRLVDAAGRERLQEALLAASTQDHVIRASLLETDTTLSTPVTADAAPAPADALVMVEASRIEVALQQAQTLAASIALPPAAVHSFQSLWRLGS